MTATKYEDVANRVVHLIDHGTFRPGTRIPSVRRLSDEMRVSVTTVLEAYRLLESRGLIESRPQSGYYVRSKPCAAPPLDCSAPPQRACAVGVDGLVLRIMQDTHNPDLVQLGAAVPNPALLPTEQLNRHLFKVARSLDRLSQLYDVPPGCEPLRVQVAQRAVKAGAILSPDDIMTTNGCLEAISLALRAICKPGDTVGIESPTYFGVLQAIELLGLRVLEIPTHPITGVSLDALRFALEQHSLAACVFMPNFNNPLGSLMPDADKKTMVELLAEHDVPLIEDDVYGDMYFGAERPRVAKAYDRKGLVLLCSSYSKDLAPGYRVGWIAPGRYKRQIMRLKAATNIATATLPSYAIADYMENGGYDHHLRRIRRAYAQQMAWMVEAAAAHFPPGTRISQPQGGFVVWLELPGAVDTIALYEDALQAGITFAPGPVFSARQKYRNFMRLNYAYWSDDVQKAVATLGRLACRATEAAASR